MFCWNYDAPMEHDVCKGCPYPHPHKIHCCRTYMLYLLGYPSTLGIVWEVIPSPCRLYGWVSQLHDSTSMCAMPLQSINLPAAFAPSHFQLKAGECHYCYCLQAGNNLMEMIPFKRSLLSFWLSGKMIVSSLRLDKIKTPSEYLIIDQVALGVSWLYSFSERLTAFQRGFWAYGEALAYVVFSTSPFLWANLRF